MISIGIIAASGKGGLVIYVYGSGTSAINQTYTETGQLNGYSRYISQDGLRHVFHFGSNWYITDIGVTTIGSQADYYFFEKSTGAPSPWLVELWQRGDLGSGNPVPTVSLTPPPSEPVAMNISGAGSGIGLPIDVPLVGELNGKPNYFIDQNIGVNDAFEIRWAVETGFNGGNPIWQVRIKNGFSYWSAEDVPYPSDVGTWTISSADPPTPTITAVY